MPPPPHRLTLAGWFSLLVPRDWAWSEEGGVTTVYQPEGGAGALNLSLFNLPGTAVPKADELRAHALRFAKNLGAHTTPEAVSFVALNHSPAAYIACHDDAGDHWRAWHAARAGQLALITYNCAAADTGREERLIDKIIGSFKWEPAEGAAGK